MSGFLSGGGGVPVGHIFHDFVIKPQCIEANGATLLRADFPALWAYAATHAATEGVKDSTQYGDGDGVTTFSLPDLRAEFLRGLDNGRGVDAGRVLGSFQADEIGQHNHENLVNPKGGTGGTLRVFDATGSNEGSGTWNSRLTGGSETRPRNAALYVQIKYAG